MHSMIFVGLAMIALNLIPRLTAFAQRKQNRPAIDHGES
jgi:hypothetical protein